MKMRVSDRAGAGDESADSAADGRTVAARTNSRDRLNEEPASLARGQQ